LSDFNVVGKSTPIIDGRAKLTGATQYLPDVELPRTLHARFVTSIYPHAKIIKIDSVAALQNIDVVAVITAADLPNITPDDRTRLLLARDRVMYAGQPVAVVVAASEAAAQDAAAAVSVDYDPLPAAITIEQALADDAPLVWPDFKPGTAGDAGTHGADAGADGDSAGTRGNVSKRDHFARGDIESGFAAADVIVERTFRTQGVHQNYLETHGMLVQHDSATGGATVWCSTQGTFGVRERVAALLEVPESDVRVIGMAVGGGFGGKFPIFEGLIALIARKLDRPVRMVLARSEDLATTNPMHPARLQVKLGAKSDGAFTALQARVDFDTGSFPTEMGGFMGVLLANNYRIPNIDVEAREILTFKTGVGAYRAPTAPQAAFAIESAIDEVAARLQADPLALRKLNAVRAGDPMTNGGAWPAMGMHEVLQALEAHPAWQERAAAQAAGRGVGVAIAGWPGGTQPAAAVCALERDGTLHVVVGAVDLTGTHTTFALLAAETFGMEPERVRVVMGDTATAPFAGEAGGSKITYTVGPAIMQAAAEARRQTLEIAAEEFEADPDDLEIVDGAVRVRGVPDRSIELQTIAAKTMQFGGKYAPIFGRGRNADPGGSPTFCAQLAEVYVDRETGAVSVERLVVVQDVGRAINPSAVRGQMAGGALQGVGWALYENLAYDAAGQLMSGTWMDYVVPHAHQAPAQIETEIVEVPSEFGPLGAKGVGEPPIIPTAAAIANAIANATGVRMTELPMTPPKVQAALADSERSKRT